MNRARNKKTRYDVVLVALGLAVLGSSKGCGNSAEGTIRIAPKDAARIGKGPIAAPATDKKALRTREGPVAGPPAGKKPVAESNGIKSRLLKNRGLE
jgi:hypothetical protein